MLILHRYGFFSSKDGWSAIFIEINHQTILNPYQAKVLFSFLMLLKGDKKEARARNKFITSVSVASQIKFTCSKSTSKTLEKGVKYVEN